MRKHFFPCQEFITSVDIYLPWTEISADTCDTLHWAYHKNGCLPERNTSTTHTRSLLSNLGYFPKPLFSSVAEWCTIKINPGFIRGLVKMCVKLEIRFPLLSTSIEVRREEASLFYRWIRSNHFKSLHLHGIVFWDSNEEIPPSPPYLF